MLSLFQSSRNELSTKRVHENKRTEDFSSEELIDSLHSDFSSPNTNRSGLSKNTIDPIISSSTHDDEKEKDSASSSLYSHDNKQQNKLNEFSVFQIEGINEDRRGSNNNMEKEGLISNVALNSDVKPLLHQNLLLDSNSAKNNLHENASSNSNRTSSTRHNNENNKDTGVNIETDDNSATEMHSLLNEVKIDPSNPDLMISKAYDQKNSQLGVLQLYISQITGRIDRLPQSSRFMLLVLGLFSFFGMHNFLQEKIMRYEGFQYGLFLGFLEVLGVTIFSYIERYRKGEHNIRKAPLQKYIYTTLCLMASSSLSNIALNYINYPTKVVFRSCKLIPTMMISTIINKKKFSVMEYISAILICVGLALFTLADYKLLSGNGNFNPLGIVYVSLSVVADAILPNLQEKLFREGSSRLEVTYYSNIFTLMIMVFSMAASGDLTGATYYCIDSIGTANESIITYMTIYALLAYIAISLHMQMVKSFGSVAAVLVGNSRKTMTIMLSFIFFPKPFSWNYVTGGMLVLGSLSYSGILKTRKSKSKSEKEDMKIKGLGEGSSPPIDKKASNVV